MLLVASSFFFMSELTTGQPGSQILLSIITERENWYSLVEELKWRTEGSAWIDQNEIDDTTSEPKPWEIRPDAAAAEPAPVPIASVEPTTTVTSVAAVVIASVWLVISILAGMTFIGTQEDVYGGDAFTGIQNTMVTATRALGWVIIGIGVLGLVTALERRVTRSSPGR